MAVLSAATTAYLTAPASGREALRSHTTAIYAGGLVGISSTGASDGLLVPWSGATACKFMGIALANSGGVATDVPVNTEGAILRNVIVASSLATTVGDLVYCSTDNPTADLTHTATTNKAVGILIRFNGSSRGDVKLFTPTEAAAL